MEGRARLMGQTELNTSKVKHNTAFMRQQNLRLNGGCPSVPCVGSEAVS